jgi:tetratricopeptide (TPR) repeat protein
MTGKQADLEQLIELYKQTPVRLISPQRRSFWVIALLKLGHSNEAEDMLNTALKKDSADFNFLSAYAILLAKKGDKAGALKKIDLCEKANSNFGHFHHIAYNLAEAYALLGDYEKSVNKLIWAADNGFPNYPYFRDDPYLISLHQFAPYNELLKKLKINWEKYRQIAKE